MTQPIPKPDASLSLLALRAIKREGHMFAALQIFHEELGDIFRIELPRLRFIMMAGPEASRLLLVSNRHDIRWRTESDPITRLLGHGLLVADGPVHDDSRQLMNPAVHKQALASYVESMWRRTDQISQRWLAAESPIEMLSEMRKIAVLILMETLFSVDYSHEMDRLWQPILRMLRYISPGVWMFFPNLPRPIYERAIKQMDVSIYQIIQNRTRSRTLNSSTSVDLLDMMMDANMDERLIRDQILTMFVAGHDTTTALLAWAIYLLVTHPDKMHKAQTEVQGVLGQNPPSMERVGDLPYLGNVIDESLRLYPPAHIGSRVALTELRFQDYVLPPETRLMYSIYLTHRDKKQWENPHCFIPERFNSPDGKRPYSPYTFLPFGGGPRNCIGAAYGQVEAKVVLARLLQKFDFEFTGHRVTPKMAVTIEPKQGVHVLVRNRQL